MSTSWCFCFFFFLDLSSNHSLHNLLLYLTFLTITHHTHLDVFVYFAGFYISLFSDFPPVSHCGPQVLQPTVPKESQDGPKSDVGFSLFYVQSVPGRISVDCL